MRILVCVRQGLDGEISPFDACAYEEALRIQGAEVILISMGALPVGDFLLNLTRLGAKKAILLSDTAFAGADTLATAYTLSLAVKRIKPDLIFCGRQSIVGDTAQTGTMLSVYAGLSLITNVMKIEGIDKRITCVTRDQGVESAVLPALLTIERINTLRLPSIMSKKGELEVWDVEDIGADIQKCGLKGSPTRVLKTFENQSGKRNCTFIAPCELSEKIEEGLMRSREQLAFQTVSDKRLKNVCIVGEAPRSFAETVSDDITVVPFADARQLSEEIKRINPEAVLWGSDNLSKRLAAEVAAMLNLGLCADCTLLETDGEKLMMYRPALSGSVIAKIESKTKPAMATVRTLCNSTDIAVCVGYGARAYEDKVKAFAESISAELVATRKAVDNDVMPYEAQVGLTGKTVSPPVYVALGVSGAVHHVVGMERSGTVIAVNPDKDAPIFEYADYGILAKVEDIL